MISFQEELQDVSQNVVTLDGEVMAVNGRILAGHSAANGRSLLAIGIEPETRLGANLILLNGFACT